MNDSIEQDLQPPQNVEIPDQLPLLPVRDIVVFPYWSPLVCSGVYVDQTIEPR